MAAIATFAVAMLAVPAFGHRIQKRFKVGSHPVVTVRNSSGKITIRSWQKPEVLVIANHNNSQKVEVGADQKGNMIEVATHILSDDVTPAELEADYDITVPQETELNVHDDSGTVDVQNVIGDMYFETVAADVSLSQITGYITAHTVGGSVTCNQCSGRIEANSISGAINVIGSETSNVQARTSTGNILLDSDLLPSGLYQLRNYSGQIEVFYSPSDSFDVTAISMRGKVESQADLKHSPNYARHLPPFARSLVGVYNEGKARLILNSFSGTIVIRQRQ